MRTLIKNGHLLDTKTMEMSEEQALVIEDGLITTIGEKPKGHIDQTFDAKGSFVLPGFIDAHVHFRLASMDFRRLTKWSEVEYGIVMARLARETLFRGFTTVRDVGGDVTGLQRAIKSGEAQGPRIISAGRFISQTGGHGDVEGGVRAVPDCACQMRHTAFGIVADGVDAVRKAARHNLREGSGFLKIHVSGGVATPSDPLDSVQYTEEEIKAVVVEAQHRHTYVAAHAYSPESIMLAVKNGVHTIEHGNLLDRAAAELMAERGAILVPTLATYEAMDQFGRDFGLPETNLKKNQEIYRVGLESLQVAKASGVTMGWGTDLIGESQARQNREFSIRGEVESAAEILSSMYQVNPKLCHLSNQIGVISPGAIADLVVSKFNPLDDINVLASPHETLEAIIQQGQLVRSA
jgi:imidazolonepropionase-like amidohydrolase